MRQVLFCTTVVWLTLAQARADDWPHWRGPNRNDVVAEPSGWNGTAWALSESWSTNVGEGGSSPLVVDGRLYTMGWRDGRDRVVCLDAETGRLLWSAEYDCPQYGRLSTGDKGVYSGPSSTPEFDPETKYLYTLSIDGDLNCWDTRQRGRKVWGMNLHERFHVPRRPKVGRSGQRDYGYTSSPLVWGDWLIVEAGAKEGNLVAFDKQTGQARWASESTSPAGHNGGPALIRVEGVPCVAIHNHAGLLVARLDAGNEGRTVATWDWETEFANNIASATVHDRYVLLTSSYNHHQIAKFEITLRGARKLWEQGCASKVCSPVVFDGHVYWAWQKVMCLDFDSGKVRWQGGRIGDPGSVIATADGRLIVWANRGDLLLVESAARSPDQYTELAAYKNLGRDDAWPHLVLAAGRLYCRDRDGNLRCFAVGR